MEATIEAPVKATTEALALPILPNDELEKISATDAGLKQLLDRAKSYATLPAITDESTYDEIHKFTMVTVKVRTESKKLAERLAEPHKLKAKQIIEEGLRIGTEAKQAEDLVRPLKEGYEAEQARLKEEKLKADAARIQDRTQTVINLGMTYKGTGYYLGDLVIDNVDIKAAPDDKFAALLAPIEAYAADLLEKARIERKNAETERQRKEKELEDERKRLNAERQAQQEETRKLAQQQAELKRQQQAVADQQKALDDARQAEEQKRINEMVAQLDKLMKYRLGALAEVGFVDQQNGYYQNAEREIDIHESQIERYTDFEFEEVIATARAFNEKQAIKAEQLRKEQEAAQKQAESDRKKADKERIARLAPDKKQVAGYLKKLSIATPFPESTEPEIKELLNSLANDLSGLIVKYREQLNTL